MLLFADIDSLYPSQILLEKLHVYSNNISFQSETPLRHYRRNHKFKWNFISFESTLCANSRVSCRLMRLRSAIIDHSHRNWTWSGRGKTTSVRRGIENDSSRMYGHPVSNISGSRNRHARLSGYHPRYIIALRARVAMSTGNCRTCGGPLLLPSRPTIIYLRPAMRRASVYCQYIVAPPAYFPNLHHARDASSVSGMARGGRRNRAQANDALPGGARASEGMI